MTRLPQIIGFIILLWGVGACQEGTVTFAPTPLPPDRSPLVYQHPSGAFDIRPPRDWTLSERDDDALASAAFTPPDSAAIALSIGAIRLDAPAETLALIDRYQRTIRPDAGRYTEIGREAMGDGSWRATGLMQTVGGDSQQVNTFFQRVDETFVVMEAYLPDDPALLAALETTINTLRINAAGNALMPASLEALAFAGAPDVRVMNLHGWTTADGVYYITGEVANFSPHPVGDVPISARLLTDDGAELASANDFVMAHSIAAGDYAPFSLRFGAGRPPEATGFRLIVGAAERTGSPTGADAITWEDRSSVTADGHLLIEGTASHDGTRTLNGARAVITVFDAAGRVIGAGFTALGDGGTLESGDSADFALLMRDIGGQPANYIVNFEAIPDAP